MAFFRHVLAPVDLSSLSRHSAAEAIMVARSCGAPVTLLYVAPRPVDDDTHDELLMCLSALAGIRMATPAIRFEIVEGDPDREILAFSNAHDVDLIVLGMRPRGRVARAFVESTGDIVAREAPCSVLTVADPDVEPPRARPIPPSRVLCAVDLSDDSHATLDTALDLARAVGARVTVLNVIKAADVSERTQGARDAVERTANEKLSSLIARHGVSGLDVERLALFGTPHTLIADTAAALDAGIVVLGAHSRKLLGYTFLGATARTVLRAAPCPVLLARAAPISTIPAMPRAHGDIVAPGVTR